MTTVRLEIFQHHQLDAGGSTALGGEGRYMRHGSLATWSPFDPIISIRNRNIRSLTDAMSTFNR